MSPPLPHHAVVIVGGGQAGLSASAHLAACGLDHVIFEKNRVGHAWREERWDAFCLVTPNWHASCRASPTRVRSRRASCRATRS